METESEGVKLKETVLLRMVTGSRELGDCVTEKPAHYTHRNLYSPCHMMAQSYPILCHMMPGLFIFLPCLSIQQQILAYYVHYEWAPLHTLWSSVLAELQSASHLMMSSVCPRKYFCFPWATL